MQVTADIVGAGEHDLDLAADAAYADLLRALDLSPHEATVLVDGSPVPEDAPVTVDRVEVLRLVKGGAPDHDATDAAPADVTVGPAHESERATALSIIDMAGLQVDREAVMAGERDVLVAVTDGRVLGALVLDGERIEAVAVRPGRQGQGIGSSLVAAAGARRERLVAEFGVKLRTFYEDIGFDTEQRGESRYLGVLD
jgi:sulfur carrier protein ThiS